MKSYLTVFLLFTTFFLSAQTFTWTEQNTPNSATLNDVYFVDDLTGWAVGDFGTILHTNNGGAIWTQQPAGTAERIDAVHFVDASTGWAVGSQNQALILKTTDGGANWNALQHNFIHTQIRDVFFADANNGWIIFRDSIFRSSDGGASWDLEDYSIGVNNGGLDNKQIFATSDSTAFIAGTYKTSSASSSQRPTVFNRNPDNSNLWQPDGFNQFDSNDRLRRICFATDSIGFAGGEKGKVFRMQSDGINYNGPWNLNFDLGYEGFINSISFPEPEKGMILSGATVNGVNYGIVHHTVDGGDNWTATPDSIPDLLLSTLHAPSADHAWAVGSFGKIFKGTRNPVSTKDYENLTDFDVFPNPFDDNFTINITLEQAENVVLKMSNINGQMILENRYNLTQGDNTIEIDQMENSDSGIYFLNLFTQKGEFITSKKVVKF